MKTYAHSNIHNSFIYNKQDLETTQMTISLCMNKQILVYPFNGIQPCNKTEQTIDVPHRNVSKEHDANRKRTSTENHILDNSIFML